MRRLRPVLLITATLVSPQAVRAQPAADVVITNAKVWTGDPAQPRASTIAIHGDRITEVSARIFPREALPAGAQFIDAQGRLVIPGLIDSHTHIVSGGLGLAQLQLRDAKDKDDFIRRVREYVEKLKPGDFVLGRGWSLESWADQTEPTRDWIDEITGERLTMLTRMDGHQALVNSKTLEFAGIKQDTPDPPGGVIVRDPRTREPTGILKDTAMDLVELFSVGHEQKLKALERAGSSFNECGVTAVQDMSEYWDLWVFSLAATGFRLGGSETGLTLRILCFPPGGEEYYPVVRGDKDWYRYVGYKWYLDGSLGSRTASMREPYRDAQGVENARGVLRPFATADPPQDMLSQFRRAAALGLQPAVHAIGDQANHLLLDAYEQLKKEFPAVRPRIEHAQHLMPEDIPRFAKIGVIASMQPYHKADDGRYAEKRLGAERCKTSYAFKSLLDSGAVVCFGSDWPVVSNNPMLGIHTAVTGKTLDGKIFVPEQNITVEQALRCYTANAAYACGMEDKLGMIKEGYLADLVILDQDILSIEVDRIPQTKVIRTIVGGKTVWPVQ